MDKNNNILPHGGKFKDIWINQNLIDKLDFFVNKSKMEENDYFYALQIEVDQKFFSRFNQKFPNWIIVKISDDKFKKINPKTNRRVNWYRLYKADYLFVKENYRLKSNNNFFSKIYGDRLKELNLVDTIYINNDIFSIPKNFTDWFFIINFCNSINQQIKLETVKFKNKIFELRDLKIDSLSEAEFIDFYKKMNNSKLRIKNYFNSIKKIRDLLAHFWNYELKDDKGCIIRKVKVLKFYSIDNELFLIIKDDTTKFNRLVVINFHDIIKAIKIKLIDIQNI
ncbi:hypothetical protein [Spiroplasma cantharicola]|uniref:Uncharacterized protein n=1 Tax=Spiroplasma cantharicola TaxID=362837 RepID=A0A0M4JSJ7_9MOLU|nr:hypothetical protein [Spiroplasma cantharicola]ALD66371.1 hypothetical protein SCANT_v1c04650 [Spiroplasma cantharicola]